MGPPIVKWLANLTASSMSWERILDGYFSRFALKKEELNKKQANCIQGFTPTKVGEKYLVLSLRIS